MILRDKIIYILEKNRGKYVSGQEMADTFGVSRSAVAKCVSQLKSEGYAIDSVNNSGHRLADDCDILSAPAISSHLNDDCEITVFKTIDSTNTQAKRVLANGSTGNMIFAAEAQTEGRGRRGKSFYSPEGKGLYFSVVLNLDIPLADSTLITAASAVAVANAIREATKKDPKIKWVNDIFIDNKKVCGILTEAVTDFESGRVQSVIIGIGINLTTDVFPDELIGIAGSLGQSINRCRMIAGIYEELKTVCAKLNERRFMEDYRKHSLVLGRQVHFSRNGADYLATAEDITDSGELKVKLQDGEVMLLNSGEISIKL